MFQLFCKIVALTRAVFSTRKRVSVVKRKKRRTRRSAVHAVTNLYFYARYILYDFFPQNALRRSARHNDSVNFYADFFQRF